MTMCPRQAGGAGQPRQQPGRRSRQHSGMQQHSMRMRLSQVGGVVRQPSNCLLCCARALSGILTHVPYAHGCL